MEYLNDRLILVANAAHTRQLICEAEQANRQCDDAYFALAAQLDQQEAALQEYDAVLRTAA